MKKSVIAMLTGALVIGTTATTFAAANPFSDVPAGHWAYNAVTRLASEGVIEGYGDNTYRGNRNITRYEMAQMVARALAKTPTANMSSTARGDLDKLAAELRDELDVLGVRVAELEEHSDMVKWTGEVRYEYLNDKIKHEDKETSNTLQIRLFPTAYVNEHWTANARFTAEDTLNHDETTNVELTYIFAEGDYDKFNLKLGRMPLVTEADQGLIVDDYFSGAQVTFGSKLKFIVNAGRWSELDSADYLGGEILYDDGEKFNVGAGYHYFKDFGSDDDDKASIWAVGAGYNLGGDISLSGTYAQNTKADDYKKGYNIQLDYAGADVEEPGSWGAYVGYRYVGENVGFAPTYDTFAITGNKKGFEIGADWTPLKNIYTQLCYFNGKTLDSDQTNKTFFGLVSFNF